MRFFLTGGTGYTGPALTELLLKEGHEVVVFHRESSDLSSLQGLSCDKYCGNLLSLPDVTQAMKGCDGVFHMAGNTSWYRRDRKEVWRANVETTRIVVEAMRTTGIRRGVLTSSVSGIGVTGEVNSPATEKTPHNWPKHFHYPQSKKAAEKIWFETDPTLEMIAVNPATIMGPGDRRWKVGAIFQKISAGKFPHFLCGGISVCDVRDVAQGHLQAYEKGVSGERYILASENIESGALGDLIARVMGVAPPKKRLGPGMVRLLMRIAGGLEFCGGGLDIAAGHLWCLLRYVYHDTTKARRDLGFQTRPFEDTVQDSVEWYREKGLMDA